MKTKTVPPEHRPPCGVLYHPGLPEVDAKKARRLLTERAELVCGTPPYVVAMRRFLHPLPKMPRSWG